MRTQNVLQAITSCATWKFRRPFHRPARLHLQSRPRRPSSPLKPESFLPTAAFSARRLPLRIGQTLRRSLLRPPGIRRLLALTRRARRSAPRRHGATNATRIRSCRSVLWRAMLPATDRVECGLCCIHSAGERHFRSSWTQCGRFTQGCGAACYAAAVR